MIVLHQGRQIDFGEAGLSVIGIMHSCTEERNYEVGIIPILNAERWIAQQLDMLLRFFPRSICVEFRGLGLNDIYSRSKLSE